MMISPSGEWVSMGLRYYEYQSLHVYPAPFPSVLYAETQVSDALEHC